MGPEEDPTDFASLIMSDKLDLFHALCEWQFHNPNNLRARMRDDDEYANWVHYSPLIISHVFTRHLAYGAHRI